MPLLEAKRYTERAGELRMIASTWRMHWKELAQYISPRRGRFEASDRSRAGSKKNSAIVNNTATRAKRILSSGMMAGLTSPARPWFRLRVRNFEHAESKAVKTWLQQVETIMLETFARTNFYNGLAQVYDDLSAFGTSAMFIEEHPTEIMRVHVAPIGSYYLGLDEYFRVNTIYRHMTFTVEQMVRRFGIDNVSRTTKQMWDAKQYDSWSEVLHVIEPNDTVMHGNMDRTGMPWRSVWIDTGVPKGSKTGDTSGSRTQTILSEGGFQEFPALTPRWTVNGEDAYGSSPGMEALGDIRALQHLERRRQQALDKAVTPPMVGSSLLKKTRVSLLSGDVTLVDIPASKQKFEPAYMVDSALTKAKEERDDHQARINGSFMADIFLMLAMSPRTQPPTAREVDEVHEEKFLQLGPTLERLYDEMLEPAINRTFAILSRRGMIPPAPEELQGQEATPEYISILAAAQKQIAIVGVERLIVFMQTLAQTHPEVVDKFNPDAAMDEAQELIGTNPELVRSQEAVDEIRQKRQQAQQLQAQDAEAALKSAQTAKTMAEAGAVVDAAPDDGVTAGMAEVMGGVAQQGVQPSA